MDKICSYVAHDDAQHRTTVKRICMFLCAVSLIPNNSIFSRYHSLLTFTIEIGVLVWRVYIRREEFSLGT